MIELEISQLFALILIVVALLAGLSTLMDGWRDGRLARMARREALRCRICGAISRRDQAGSLQKCPECGSPSRGGRDRRLG